MTRDKSDGKYYLCFDLNSAAELNDGQIMSTAMVIYHEMGHASAISKDEASYDKRVAATDNQYGNAEEKNNITTIENPKAKELGEPIRQDHSMKQYIPVDDVTYHKTH